MSLSTPAWRRLGLKLKYAKDQPDTVNVLGAGRTSTAENGEERPHKRQRTNKLGSEDSHHVDLTRNSALISESSNFQTSPQVSGQATETAVPNTPKRRKSVTFSTDTKASDGDTRITIDFPAGSPGSTPYKASNSRDTVQSALATTNAATQDTAEKGARRTKKKKVPSAKKLSRQHSNVKAKPDSALPYLAQHRTERSSWKFNKNRDVWIVSHALDTSAIPTSHILALAGYVQGLPMNAGSRQRLVRECKARIAETDDQNIRTKDEEKKFLALLREEKINADTQDDFLEHIPRPVILLWALGETITHSNGNDITQKPVTLNGQLPERKRKSRTAAPVDISSSESESDTDSSSSDSDDDESGTLQSNGVKVISSADETSSSGTDTSSSGDSDSDSDSSSENETDSE